MRKSDRPPPPAPFEFLIDVLPQFATDLQASLRRIRRPDLASQVPELRIYGRGNCGTKCGTFYCLPPDEMQKVAGLGNDISMIVTEARGKIIRVETLGLAVDAVLEQLFPASGTNK